MIKRKITNKKINKNKEKQVLNLKPAFASKVSLEERAYYIWENKGRPENAALDNWLEAESSVNSN